MFASLNAYVPSFEDKQLAWDAEQIIANKEIKAMPQIEGKMNTQLLEDMHPTKGRRIYQESNPVCIEHDRTKIDPLMGIARAREESGNMKGFHLNNVVRNASKDVDCGRSLITTKMTRPEVSSTMNYKNGNLVPEYEERYVVGEVVDDDEYSEDGFVKERHTTSYGEQMDAIRRLHLEEERQRAGKPVTFLHKGIRHKPRWNLDEMEYLDEKLQMSFEVHPEYRKGYVKRDNRQSAEIAPMADNFFNDITKMTVKEGYKKKDVRVPVTPDEIEEMYAADFRSDRAERPGFVKEDRRVPLDADTMIDDYIDMPFNVKEERALMNREEDRRIALGEGVYEPDMSALYEFESKNNVTRLQGVNRQPRKVEDIDAHHEVLECNYNYDNATRPMEKRIQMQRRKGMDMKSMDELYNDGLTAL